MPDAKFDAIGAAFGDGLLDRAIELWEIVWDDRCSPALVGRAGRRVHAVELAELGGPMNRAACQIPIPVRHPGDVGSEPVALFAIAQPFLVLLAQRHIARHDEREDLTALCVAHRFGAEADDPVARHIFAPYRELPFA